MNKINEGQTQVYMDGHIDHQYGVDTADPYLNKPPKQLLDITTEFMRSGKTDSQVLAILVGMGIPQQLAQSSITNCKNTANDNVQENKQQKNDIKMNFTLTQLYENINSSLIRLNEMTSDSTRISYSSKRASIVLEQSLDLFPGINITESNVKKLEEKLKIEKEAEQNAINERNYELAEKSKNNYNELKNQIIEETKKTAADLSSEEISKAFNESSNPVLKYKIAKTVYNNTREFDWLNSINELRSYLDQAYLNNKWSFKIVEAIDSLSRKTNTLHENLTNELLSVINENDVKTKFKSVVKKYPWSTECSSILNEMNVEEQKSISRDNVSVNRVFSPILNENGGYHFHLNGSNYFIKDNKIEESNISDARYHNIIDVLGFSSIKEDFITFYGQNDKFLEYNLTEGTLKLGDMDLTESSIAELRNALLTNRLFHFAETNKVDKICMAFENIDMLAEMDNLLNLSSNEFLNVHLTLIAVEEGVWVNKINPSMKINEMVFYSSAEKALSETKSFIGYDPSSYLSEKLINEGNERAIVENKRTKINNKISALEEKKADVQSVIKKIGESDELKEALALVDSEIKKAEKELQETYVSESKLSKAEIDEYANDGYVEASLKKTIGPNFRKGQEIMVNAEEYASLGKGDLLKIVNPGNGETKLVDKGDLKVDL